MFDVVTDDDVGDSDVFGVWDRAEAEMEIPAVKSAPMVMSSPNSYSRLPERRYELFRAGNKKEEDRNKLHGAVRGIPD